VKTRESDRNLRTEAFGSQVRREMTAFDSEPSSHAQPEPSLSLDNQPWKIANLSNNRPKRASLPCRDINA